MRKFSTAIAVSLAFALALAAAGPALGAQSSAVTDCVSHGQLTQAYSEGQLRSALSTMSAATKEYTDCSDVIERALLTDLGKPVKTGKNVSSTSGGSFLPTPVIVALALLVLAGVTFGAIAIRRRQAVEDPPGDDGAPPSGS